MGKLYDRIEEREAAFITAQRLFFVATAPASTEGHVNLSPKGLDTFAILGPRTVAYLDLTGSGVETIAHLRENGRITIMFCALEGPPRILRLQGRGEAVLPGDERFADLRSRFGEYPGVRSVIVVELTRISDSCGFGVPRFVYEGERDQLLEWARSKGDDGLHEYRSQRNAESIDGLEGLPA